MNTYSLPLAGYSVEDIIRLEARIYAIERYIREHDPEGGWFLDQEFYKWLTPVAARHGNVELTEKLHQEKLAHEERCQQQDIEIKFP